MIISNTFFLKPAIIDDYLLQCFSRIVVVTSTKKYQTVPYRTFFWKIT